MWKDGLLVKLQRSGIQDNMYRWQSLTCPTVEHEYS
jgi:hypothetical protein